MQLLDTSKIDGFPDSVLVGFTDIKLDYDLEILSDSELQELEGFTNLQRKNEYLSVRHLFKFMLQELGFSPSECTLYKEELGKPYALLNDKMIHLSFTHSTNLVFCVISENLVMGVDCEPANRVVNQKVVKRILNENEWKVLGEENPLKLWTLKEAAVKCLGTGLRTNLKDLEIKARNKYEFSIQLPTLAELKAWSFEYNNHFVAVAVKS